MAQALQSNATRAVDFFDVKGDLERVLDPLNFVTETAQHPALHLSRSARPGGTIRLGERGPVRGRSIPGRCGARRRGMVRDEKGGEGENSDKTHVGRHPGEWRMPQISRGADQPRPWIPLSCKINRKF
mgnify:CR=1 FL=1